MGELHRETSRLLYSKVDRAIPISTSCLLTLQGILGKENLQLGRNPRFLDIRSSRQNASALFLPVTGAGCHTVYPLCVPHSLLPHVPHSLLPATKSAVMGDNLLTSSTYLWVWGSRCSPGRSGTHNPLSSTSPVCWTHRHWSPCPVQSAFFWGGALIDTYLLILKRLNSWILTLKIVTCSLEQWLSN